MSTYKGNVGNLMQHWTLCELLSIAGESEVTGLSFIDAHAMVPLARERTGHGVVFDRVSLPRVLKAAVETRAWW